VSQPADLSTIVAIAAAAAVPSIIGGSIALWHRPMTLFIRVCCAGFASGVLLATIGFEMLPLALELGSQPVAVGGFVGGFLFVYALEKKVADQCERSRLAESA
jgi:zinc transporter, ZIP family